MLFADDQSIVAARVNGVLRDLTYVIEDGDTVEPIAIDSPEGRAILRHSTAHVLAQAAGSVPQGEARHRAADRQRVLLRLRRPAAVPSRRSATHREADAGDRRRVSFSRREVTDEEARAELADEPYKLELIGLKGAAGTEGVDVEVGVSS